MEIKKEWYKSKMFWVNALAIAGGVFSILSGELQVGGTLTIAGCINIVLRVLSKHEIIM